MCQGFCHPEKYFIQHLRSKMPFYLSNFLFTLLLLLSPTRYRRLCGLISPVSVSNSVQLWQQSLHVWHFVEKNLPPPIKRGLLPTLKEPDDWIWMQLLGTFVHWHFAPQHRFFVPKNCTILVCFHGLVSFIGVVVVLLLLTPLVEVTP